MGPHDVSFAFTAPAASLFFVITFSFALYLYVQDAAARRGPGPISAASRRRPAALSRARLLRSECRFAKAARSRLVTLGPSLPLDRANNTCVRFFILNSCFLSCIFTYRALPPLRGSRPDVGSTPMESRTPIPRTALSGLTAGLRQRGLLEAFNPFVGCFYIHAAQRSPLSYSSRSAFRVAQLWPRRGPATLFRKLLRSLPASL